jgi:PAS domain S-box-containing protein
VEADDAIGRLAHAFNQMTVQLQATLGKLEQQLARLADVNLDLEGQIIERQRVEEQLKEAQSLLEQRVKERTADLFTTNVRLKQEISERQQAEDSLRESEEKFRSVVEQSYDGILLINEAGRIIEWNHGYEEITGVPRAEALNQFAWDMQYLLASKAGRKRTGRLRKRYRAGVMAFLSPDEPGGHMLQYEFDIQREDGEIRTLNSLTFRLQTGQGPLACAISRDVTEQKQAKARELALAVERERSRLLTQFILSASHEFRTPLSIINLKLHLLAQTIDPDQQATYLQNIHDQSENILTLVEALVTMSRLDAGMTFARDAFDLNDFVRQIHAVMQPTFEASAITTTLNLQGDLPVITGDAEQLHLAFSNILNNAVRYTPGGGRIDLRTYTSDDQVVLEIADTGIGIRADHLPYVFDRFFRADEAHSTRGFGLGLSIAKKIIDGHNGHIDVDSTPGVGTTFRVSFPQGGSCDARSSE